ncbi:FAD-binding oxidoreductase [Palleronia sp. LCG004]|uniref:NAD(P)/FAD-dependent oxidoreductase n=1 Tax=Palleronia sp. LCG004 TaxID=3079304 RepID=UPI002941D95A|nr:FAD-binding oxidoreductase [Palleronia sp. LCG004]WOI56857.1 FAD-binding oxidoreductase [Palleronia sp. LCG004]
MRLPPLPASLWRDQVPEVEAVPLKGDCRCDVAIVGGGYAGLHAALALAEAGEDVVLAEAGWVGTGGSGRNGGVVSAKFRRGFDDLARLHGIDMSRRMHDIAHESVDHLIETLGRLGIEDADFTANGQLKCAHSQAAFDHLRAQSRWQADTFGTAPARLLDAAEVEGETGSPGFVGGLLQEEGGTIRPLAYLAGLWRGARRKGIALHAGTPITELIEEAGRVRLRHPGGEIVADRVLLATNAYSWLTPAGATLARSLVPFRSAMVATAPLSEAASAKFLSASRSYTETRRMMRWFRKIDGRIVFGGRGALGAVESPAAYRRLEKALVGIFPDLDGVAIDYRWSGQVALTFDGLPHAGRLSDRVFYAGGFNGAGVAMSGYVGDRIGRMMHGERVDLGLIARESVPRVPFYPLRAIGVRAATFGSEIMDAIGR